MNWFDFGMRTLLVIVFLIPLILTSRTKPLIGKRCRDCSVKNKDWKIVATGHDNFAWQHNCESSK